jgi:hypothetical protein
LIPFFVPKIIFLFLKYFRKIIKKELDSLYLVIFSYIAQVLTCILQRNKFDRIKKLLKKYLLALFFSYLASQTVFGQDTLSVINEHMAKIQSDRFARELSLSETQSKKVYDVLLERIEAIKLSHKGEKPLDERIRSINDETLEKLKAILTVDQFNMFIKINSDLIEQKKAYISSGFQMEASLDDQILDFSVTFK